MGAGNIEVLWRFRLYRIHKSEYTGFIPLWSIIYGREFRPAHRNTVLELEATGTGQRLTYRNGRAPAGHPARYERSQAHEWGKRK
jgi:hypothetical protein